MAASELFGRRVKSERALAGLTQADLAAALTGSGIRTAPTTISEWEGGRRSPTLDQFVVLCTLFGWAGDERARLAQMLLDGAEA